ncbi:tumor necrosis factor ligand superfamily member 11 [Menidia menidia]|uniref:(Atlantic silverside) hypothetical protein n=1 Tax=Menidia menidia TaxID=238744 RepID=A0A8S4AH26_9TELE|nr:unnamed protein product [Menidia menidia]
MAATHGEYRAYLRNSVDIEAGQHRFHPVHTSEGTYRPLLFGTLAVMGLLQVASSVAILLHLTGYLQEVDLSRAPHRPIEEVQTQPVLNALKDPKKGKKSLPSAHLPIKANQTFSKKLDPSNIEWDEIHGNLHKMRYQRGKLVAMESGFYYVYAQTCFRYYKVPGSGSGSGSHTAVGLSNTQLIQYVYHESIKQNSHFSLLMKTGSTMRWNDTSYNMYCAQQGRGLRLFQGDGLFVKVSNARMLDPEAEGTYFGAIKLSN